METNTTSTNAAIEATTAATMASGGGRVTTFVCFG